MPYFYTTHHVKENEPSSLEGAEAHHALRVRRYSPGDTIEVQDNKSNRGLLTINEVGRDHLRGVISRIIKTPPPSPLSITLYQAVTKKPALESIVQHATELGVQSIVLFQAKHSPFTFAFDHQRWQRIASEACKQSGRSEAPIISHTASLSPSNHSSLFVLDDSGTTSLPSLQTTYPSLNNCGIVIGPEGGLHTTELQNNTHIITLGPRTLRAETAALSSIAIAQSLWGDAQ
ncbi:MAG: RsmE family RNA methyltransferase [bacterium]|nr:RsmE family RNA methyltransferase [bacterium]